ncbi:hypothetical protein IF651_10715 [Cellulosimicrobium arenosum]|uniref:Uncharacterized protein n=1 Tax=Cellulosimicrobium arenosum TaxID=2708133 RepID=A0A927J0D0_9MICO|nr:hypothetical protein [Cellulosimicrobium arenosum]
MPPRLSATAMFWWGVGLFAAGIVLNELLARRAGAYGSPELARVLQSVFGIGHIAGTAAYQLGIATLVGSFVVRALKDEWPLRQTQPKKPQKH